MKFNKTFLSILVFCLLLVSQIKLQAYPKSKMGAAFSSINGAGLSYLMELDNYSAVTINGFAYYRGEEPPNKIKTYGSVGVGYQYNLHKSDLGRLFLNPGMSFWYLESKDYYYVKLNDEVYNITNNKLNRIFNLGIGVGYEFDLGKRFTLITNLEYFTQYSKSVNFSNVIDRSPNGNNFTGFGGGLMIHYKF
jgi:hypothetical protein